MKMLMRSDDDDDKDSEGDDDADNEGDDDYDEDEGEEEEEEDDEEDFNAQGKRIDGYAQQVLGKRLRKTFKGADYNGTVTRFDDPYFFVVYDDGDKEHLSQDELTRWLWRHTQYQRTLPGTNGASQAGGAAEDGQDGQEPMQIPQQQRATPHWNPVRRRSSEQEGDPNRTSASSNRVVSTFHDGRHVAQLLEALDNGDGARARNVARDFCKQKPEQPLCLPMTPGPGTAPLGPDSADIDSVSMIVPVDHFCRSVDPNFNVTIGGDTVPGSCRTIFEKTGLHFFGAMNGNIWLLVSAHQLPELLDRMNASCIPPSVRSWPIWCPLIGPFYFCSGSTQSPSCLFKTPRFAVAAPASGCKDKPTNSSPLRRC